MADAQVIFIGGGSGVGTSTTAFALHVLLSEQDVRHAVIEGDGLDLAHPAPWKHRLDVHRLDTEGKTLREIAGRIVDLAGWGAASDDGLGPAN